MATFRHQRVKPLQAAATRARHRYARIVGNGAGDLPFRKPKFICAGEKSAIVRAGLSAIVANADNAMTGSLLLARRISIDPFTWNPVAI